MYWNKRAFKRMFNNVLFEADCKKYDEYLKTLKHGKNQG